MPIGVARGALDAQKGFSFAISSASANANLRTLANTAGYPGSGNCTITINSGVDMYSTSSGTAALVPGSWPSGVTVTLVNKGTVSGAGGNGGAGNPGGFGGPGTAGYAGGTALDATGVSGYIFKVDNSSGVLRGGGGGGGGGAAGDACGGAADGGGGGGGQGNNGGAGAYYGGGNGSSSAPGAGGPPQYQSAAGGSGGAFGAAGGSGSTFPCSYPAAPGGAAGYAVKGNANIVWIATGTRTGPVA
jgi:Phage tail fibre adhesin Gp38